jgi:hypothetical protein
MKLIPVPSREEFIKALEESLRYCKEVDDSGSIDHEMGRWQLWIQSWNSQIYDENGGL